RLEDLLLGARVHARERVIQDERAPFQRERARQRDALLLSTGKSDAALANHRLEPLRELREIRPEPGLPRDGFRVRRGLTVVEAETDVRADGVGEEEAFLRHDPERAPQSAPWPLRGGNAAEQHHTLRGLEQPLHE